MNSEADSDERDQHDPTIGESAAGWADTSGCMSLWLGLWLGVGAQGAVRALPYGMRAVAALAALAAGTWLGRWLLQRVLWPFTYARRLGLTRDRALQVRRLRRDRDVYELVDLALHDYETVALLARTCSDDVAPTELIGVARGVLYDLLDRALLLRDLSGPARAEGLRQLSHIAKVLADARQAVLARASMEDVAALAPAQELVERLRDTNQARLWLEEGRDEAWVEA